MCPLLAPCHMINFGLSVAYFKNSQDSTSISYSGINQYFFSIPGWFSIGGLLRKSLPLEVLIRHMVRSMQIFLMII